MTLTPWERAHPHPRDKDRHGLRIARIAFWIIAAVIAAIVWSAT